jgi:filamentous hemagglutinin
MERTTHGIQLSIKLIPPIIGLFISNWYKEKNFTSEHIIDANDALDTGHEYLGPGYRQLGKPDSGVFRSADNLRRFRIDNGSIQGTHEPNVPHVHLERLDPVNPKRVLSNNHVPIINY